MEDKNSRITANEKLDKFVMAGSPVDSNLTRLDIGNEQEQIDTSAGVFNEMLSQVIDGQTALVPVKAKGGKKTLFSYVALSYDASAGSEVNLSLPANKKISAYEQRIYNAVFTLILAGKPNMSATEIFCVASGYTNMTPNSKQIETVLKAMIKANSINIAMDISAELAADAFPNKQALVDAGILKDIDDNIKKGTFQGKLLPVDIADITSEKGVRSISFKVQGVPILLRYNMAKQSLISIPMEYIGNRNISGMQNRVIAIQDYLLKRVIGYQKGYFKSNKIYYATILEAIAEDSTNKTSDSENESVNTKRQKKYRDRQNINSILDAWVKTGLIDSYSEIMAGEKQPVYKGVEFVLTKHIDGNGAPKIDKKGKDK